VFAKVSEGVLKSGLLDGFSDWRVFDSRFFCEVVNDAETDAIQNLIPLEQVRVHYPHLQSISSTFYARVFYAKFWRQKIQSCVLGLRFFGAKILYKKRTRKTLMKLTPSVKGDIVKNDITHLFRFFKSNIRGYNYMRCNFNCFKIFENCFKRVSFFDNRIACFSKFNKTVKLSSARSKLSQLFYSERQKFFPFCSFRVSLFYSRYNCFHSTYVTSTQVFH